jgi:hypothetical protein
MAAEYQDCLVSYIDLLGFSDLISWTKQDPSKVDIVFELLAAFEQTLGTGNIFETQEPPAKYQSMTFSDLVVRVVPLENEASLADAVSRELFYLAMRQYGVTAAGVWLRGGMCRGPIYIDGKVVFGPALVKAYSLEKAWAIFPRIIVDRKLHEAVEQIDKTFVTDLVRQSEDGAYFIDYLFAVARNAKIMGGPEEEDVTVLKKHQERLHKRLSNVTKKDPRVKQKIMWACLYHNSTIDRLCAIYQQDTTLALRSPQLQSLKILPDQLRF